MPIPDYQSLMLPVLRVLADGRDHSARSVIDALSDETGLTDEERRQLVGSQRITLMASRVHWAMTYLAQAGLTERPARGFWRISTEGKTVLDAGVEALDVPYLSRYDAFREFVNRVGSSPDGDEEDRSDESDARSAGPALPMIDDLLRPILDVIADAKPHHLRDVVQAVSDLLELDADARNRRIPSGRTIIENRVGWARTSLLKAGLVDQPEAGVVMLTAAGADFLGNHAGPDGDLLKRECPSYANWLADMGGEVPIRERSDTGKPAVWMVRAGAGGIYTSDFIDHSAVMLGWGAVGDVAGSPWEDIVAAVGRLWPEYKRIQRGQAAGAVYRFAADMRRGDVVLTPEPATRTLILGEVTGDYQYLDPPKVSDYNHSRGVRWIARVSRDELSYGARNSLATAMTLSRPPHEEELLRLAEVHASGPAPSPLAQAGVPAVKDQPHERVVISLNAAAPPRATSDEFHTIPRTMLQLLTELHTGLLALPDFQRSFVWAPDATRELLVSMIRAFPAGALLFLQGGSATFKARAAEEAPKLTGRPSFLVLDGQQRLTSLYQAIYGVGDSRFFLDIGSLLAGAEIDQAVKVLSADRAAAFASVEVQARSLMMPLSAVREHGAARWRDTVIPLRDDEHRERVRDLLRDVEYACIDPLVKYAFPVTVLPETTPLEAVCTIFETLNRTGKPLTPFELISARAFKGGLSLYDYWSAAVERYPVLAEYEVEPYYLLQCIALRLGRSCKRGSVLGLKADDISGEWNDVIADLASVLGMLRDDCGVITSKWLPYRPMLIPLASAWRDLRSTTGPAQGAMRAKLKRWFWCACFTGEYESSSATLAERDTPILRSWLSDGPEPDVVVRFAWDPERWRTVTVRQQGLYRATIALTLTRHPRDFHTAAPLTPDLIEASKVDDHHVFPRGYLRDSGRGDEIDSVLNHCLIDRATNIRIGKRAPSAYLHEIRAEHGSLSDQVLESQCLPTGISSPLSIDDYDGFLSWRMDLLRDVLGAASGGLLAPAPAGASGTASTLDVQVQAVELELRRLIDDALGGDVAALPSHVSDRISERLTTARRKNPAVGDGRYDALMGKLEYCDLRELQDIISAKAAWPAFEARFGTKETLNLRFGQLAELRNRIRHSRTLDEVTRKDGEAALLWFRQLLAARV